MQILSHFRSRKYFAETEFPRLHAEVFEKVRLLLSSAKDLSFTTDAWNSKDLRHSILSLTVYYLDEDFQPRYLVVDAKPIKGCNIYYCKYLLK